MRPSLARGCGVVGSEAETGSGFVARPMGGGARGRDPRGLAAGGRDIFVTILRWIEECYGGVDSRSRISMYFALCLSRRGSRERERERHRLAESVFLLLLRERIFHQKESKSATFCHKCPNCFQSQDERDR